MFLANSASISDLVGFHPAYLFRFWHPISLHAFTLKVFSSHLGKSFSFIVRHPPTPCDRIPSTSLAFSASPHRLSTWITTFFGLKKLWSIVPSSFSMPGGDRSCRSLAAHSFLCFLWSGSGSTAAPSSSTSAFLFSVPPSPTGFLATSIAWAPIVPAACRARGFARETHPQKTRRFLEENL